MWPAVPTTRFLRAIVRVYLRGFRGYEVSRRCASWPDPAEAEHLATPQPRNPVTSLRKLPRQPRILPQRLLQIHRVHHRLAAEVVVRDHVRLLLARHRRDPLHPRRELLLRVEVVVALPRLRVREPLLEVAAVQAGVADRAGD